MYRHYAFNVMHKNVYPLPLLLTLNMCLFMAVFLLLLLYFNATALNVCAFLLPLYFFMDALLFCHCFILTIVSVS